MSNLREFSWSMGLRDTHMHMNVNVWFLRYGTGMRIEVIFREWQCYCSYTRNFLSSNLRPVEPFCCYI